MKCFKLLLSILCLSNFAFSQIVISAEANKRLFLGLQNPLSIVACQLPCSAIVVKTSQGELRRVGECRYMFYPSTAGEVRFDVINKKTKTITPFMFRVSKLPPPIALVGRLSDTISKIEMASQLGIRAEVSPEIGLVCTDGIVFKIDKCRILIFREGKLIFSEETNNQYFSETQKAFFNTLENNDKIYLIDISATGPGGPYELAPLHFTIRNTFAK
jgi:hypothetical protein